MQSLNELRDEMEQIAKQATDERTLTIPAAKVQMMLLSAVTKAYEIGEVTGRVTACESYRDKRTELACILLSGMADEQGAIGEADVQWAVSLVDKVTKEIEGRP